MTDAELIEKIYQASLEDDPGAPPYSSNLKRISEKLLRKALWEALDCPISLPSEEEIQQAGDEWCVKHEYTLEHGRSSAFLGWIHGADWLRSQVEGKK